MDKKLITFFSVIILICIIVLGGLFDLFFKGTPSTPTSLVVNTTMKPSPPNVISSSTNATISPASVLTYTTIQVDAIGCPLILTEPPDTFSCPRNLPPLPELYQFQDPSHPTQKELDAIPVTFSGVDRTTLITSALNNSCVTDFLASGGDILGITSSPHPTVKTQGEPWPPVLYGYRRINCTEMLVLFDIDPMAKNVSGIHIDVM